MKSIFFSSPSVLACLAAITSSSFAYGAEYKLCNSANRGDIIVYLYKNNGKPCWKKLNSGDELKQDNLYVLGDKYSLAYIFEPNESGAKFDPIFNVQVKKLLSEKEKDKQVRVDNKVSIKRREISTNCDRRNTKKADGVVYSEVEAEVDGILINQYHGEPRKKFSSGSALHRFHVGFESRSGACEATDGRKRRGAFAVGEIEFQPTPNLIAEFFGIKSAIAGGNHAEVYKKVKIVIGKGQFSNGKIQSNFKIESDFEYDIILRDLSGNDDGLQRIKIRK